jgi:hypothetical protein
VKTASPAVAKAAPAKNTSATAVKATAVKPAAKATPMDTQPSSLTKPSSQLDVGSVIAQAAVGATAKVKRPGPNLPIYLKVGTPDSDDSGDSESAVNPVTLEIFGSGCLVCRALVDDQDLDPLAELPKCHFSRGVDLCPAQHIKIRAIGGQRMAARKLIKARDSGEVLRFTRLLSDLSTKDADFQAEVLKIAGITLGQPSDSSDALGA